MFLGQPNRQLTVLISNAPGLEPPLDLVLHDLVFIGYLHDDKRIDFCFLLEKGTVQFSLLVQRLLQ